MRISFAPDPAALHYLFRRLGFDYSDCNVDGPNWLCFTAYDGEGRVAGAVVSEFKTEFDAHFTIALDDPRAVTRRALRAYFTALFSRAVRVTALLEPSNVTAIAKAQRMGFRIEGRMRKGIDGKRDAVILGMLREDCAYLGNVSRETPLKLIKGGRHGV